MAFQTRINAKQAFGVPGEIYELTPWIADAVELAAATTFGTPVGRSSAGAYGPLNGTYTTFVGLAVRPKESVSYGTSGAPLAATLTAAAGTTIQTLSMGRAYVLLAADEYDATDTYAVGDVVAHEGKWYRCSTAIVAAEAWTVGHWTEMVAAIGASLYYDSTQAVYTLVSSGNTLVGKIVVGGAPNEVIAVQL